jgi:hypothetical protein
MRSTFPFHAGGRARPALRLGVAAALLGLAAACGGTTATDTATPERQAVTAETAGKVVRAATLEPGQPVPPPTQKPVLTMTGKISAANRGQALVFDQRTLGELRLVQVRLYEPWAKKTMEFRGVWLQDLLAVAGVRAGADKLHMTALDDYEVVLTMAEVRSGGIMLATKAGDGSAIPIDKGGPIRIVFMDGVKAGANPDQWIWSLKTIDVE